MDATTELHHRLVAGAIDTALSDTPIVLLTGPRQCGKTTLVRDLTAGRKYITLDDDTALAAARSDPAGLLRGVDRATIDEVQRAPDLLRAIKRTVDENRQPGRFLLTGSSNLMTVPTVSESLAGRMEIVSLLPLAQAEILGSRPEFLDRAFAAQPAQPATLLQGTALMEAALAGGFPEMLRRANPARRAAWARDYTRAIVERDVREAAEIDQLDRMPRLVRMLAHYAGQMANFSQMGGQLGLDDKTARRYLSVLEQLYMVRRMEPWSRNHLSRLVKTPKLHFVDSGLLAALLGLRAATLPANRPLWGRLLETFVVAEVLRLLTWSDRPCAVSYYRDKDQDEVDLVLEDEQGAVVGIEVKASATVTAADFKGLRKLRAGARSDSCDSPS